MTSSQIMTYFQMALEPLSPASGPPPGRRISSVDANDVPAATAAVPADEAGTRLALCVVLGLAALERRTAAEKLRTRHRTSGKSTCRGGTSRSGRGTGGCKPGTDHRRDGTASAGAGTVASDTGTGRSKSHPAPSPSRRETINAL